MEIVGYIAATMVGLLLGLIGGGGSILTVPILVYLMNIDPVSATTYSLFIVGVTSGVGGSRAYMQNHVDFKSVTEFGIPSILSIFVTRHFILPAIPDELFTVGNTMITKNIMLMVVFAILMLSASISIIRNNDSEEETTNNKGSNGNTLAVMLLGLAIGFITGLLGAGGGFLIIPVLVLFLKLPMKTAVGSSLLIIAINSLFGFLFSLKQTALDWKLLLLFTGLSIIGIYVGGKMADKIPGKSLKKFFGWFILAMGLYIIIRELLLK